MIIANVNAAAQAPCAIRPMRLRGKVKELIFT
jgi:hypothetical protein